MDAETEGAQANHGGDSPPGVRRACDQCRLRKIRCDKESPCSNCRSARRTCSSLGLGQKPKEPRQRVLISTQYEKKIDFMGDRLAVIEDLIRNLPLGASPGQPSSSSSASAQLPPRPSFAAGSSAGSPYENDGDGRRPSTPSPGARGQTAATGPGLGAAADDDDDAESSSVFDDPEDVETFEGPSSLAAHAALASDFAASAASAAVTPFSGPDARMDAALSSLRQMVSLLRNSRGGGGDNEGDTHAAAADGGWPLDGSQAAPVTSTSSASSSSHPPYRGRLRDLPMPPVDRVTTRLRALKSAPGPGLLVVVTCFTDMDLFMDRCRRVYLHTSKGDIPAALFIIVNAGLVYLFFEEAINAPPGPEKEMLTRCTAMCRTNVEAAIAQLPLLMPASLEHIEALLMAASCAIDVSRPSLAWLLTSRAAHMCRALGLHQATPPPRGGGTGTDDEAAARGRALRALMFWSTYMLDKGLSLRLGRASVLQDYDISVPRTIELPPAALATGGNGQAAPPPGLPGLTNQAVLGLWIKHAEVQGRIYQRLYSPGALRQGEAARARQVDGIVADLQVLRRETARLRADVRARGAEDRVFALILQSDEVSYLSSLALAYRAVPPAPSGAGAGAGRSFAGECLDAARAAMRCHTDIMESMGETGMKVVYLHWTILYAPFIPFIVIFCHIIETAGSQTFANSTSSSSMFPGTATAAAATPGSGGGNNPSTTTTPPPPQPSHPLHDEIRADLHLLDLFIRSLDDGRASSAALAQLHHLSRVLRNVAALYVEAKTASAMAAASAAVSAAFDPLNSSNNNNNNFLGPVGDEFDLYLSQLGFMPMDEDGGAGAMGGGPGAAAAGMPPPAAPVGEEVGDLFGAGGGLDGGDDVDMLRNVQLGDWFSGNNHILGLVEEDLSGFNAPGW